jgi:heme iron utilization protein
MPSDTPVSKPSSGSATHPASTARELVRLAWKGALATLSRADGHPYASLVAVACEPDGSPVLLLSRLAEHSKNIFVDQRVSLMLDGTTPGPQALTGPRLSLVGKLTETTSTTARRRYLARHAGASQYIDFADFKLYALDIEWGHLVAGFGRIHRLDRTDLLIAVADAAQLVEAEADILDHMNADHADVIALLAEHLAAGSDSAQSDASGSGVWTLLGCDPEGCDLARGSETRRIVFDRRLKTPDDARFAFVDLARQARQMAIVKTTI